MTRRAVRRGLLRGLVAACFLTVVAAGSLALAGSAHADSTECTQAGCADWAGTTWSAHAPSTAEEGTITLAGLIQNSHLTRFFNINAWVDPAGASGPCAAPTDDASADTDQWSLTPAPTTGSFSVDLHIDCNGTYDVTAVIATNHPGDGTITLTTTLTVARPAPAVSDVKATAAADRVVTLTWAANEGSPVPHDFTGYTISRSPAFAKDVSIPPGTKSYKDTSVPAVGGTFIYTVTSNRAATHSTAAAKPVVVTGDGSGPPLEPTPTTQPGTPTTSPISITPGAPGSGGGITPGGITVTGGGSHGGVNTGNAPTPAQASSPDEGYETDLPYEDAGAGAVAAELPDDAGPESLAGSGLVVPFAVALVLGVWGVLALYVTRQASANDAALSLLHIETEFSA